MPEETKQNETDEEAPALGRRLQALRTFRGLTYSDLGSKATLSSQAVEAIEKGRTKEPSFTKGLRLAAALGVSPYELAGEPDPGTVAKTEIEQLVEKAINDRLSDFRVPTRVSAAGTGRHLSEDQWAALGRVADNAESLLALLRRRATKRGSRKKRGRSA